LRNQIDVLPISAPFDRKVSVFNETKALQFVEKSHGCWGVSVYQAWFQET